MPFQHFCGKTSGIVQAGTESLMRWVGMMVMPIVVAMTSFKYKKDSRLGHFFPVLVILAKPM
jgi:hypothetical protein